LQIGKAYFLQIATRDAYSSGKNPFSSREKGWHWACDKRLADKSTLGAIKMADLIFIVITVVFFAIALAYVRGCDRL
jgi:hypothetical protein